jgi:hypothetical protein
MVSAAATDADAGHNLGWRYLLPAGGVAIATGLVFDIAATGAARLDCRSPSP